METKELLKTIEAQQVVIFKKLDKIEHLIKGDKTRFASIETYAQELRKEAEEVKNE
ncbi:MAG: hypothetical protein AB9922_07340 [Bacteroidales bacterium]